MNNNSYTKWRQIWVSRAKTLCTIYVHQQQEILREERRLNREEAQRQREEAQRQREAEDRAREDAAAARAHELKVIRLRGEPQNNQQRNNNAKSPKLPSFNEETDQMD